MYLSTYESGLDDKRRMTVPAAFRAVLRDKEGDGVLIWKSFRGAYLEGAGMDYILKIKAALDDMDPYDDAREAFETAIFGGSRQFALDSAGRLVLPEDFCAHAGLDERAVIVGVGDSFQVWSPEAYTARERNARDAANQHRAKLVRSQSLAPVGGFK
ncbi:MAG: division/cell wall cluster transcriptional repressor MraZ [Caulobacterales bacterium]